MQTRFDVDSDYVIQAARALLQREQGPALQLALPPLAFRATQIVTPPEDTCHDIFICKVQHTLQ